MQLFSLSDNAYSFELKYYKIFLILYYYNIDGLFDSSNNDLCKYLIQLLYKYQRLYLISNLLATFYYNFYSNLFLFYYILLKNFLF